MHCKASVKKLWFRTFRRLVVSRTRHTSRVKASLKCQACGKRPAALRIFYTEKQARDFEVEADRPGPRFELTLAGPCRHLAMLAGASSRLGRSVKIRLDREICAAHKDNHRIATGRNSDCFS